MRPEADHAHRRHREQAEHARERDAETLAATGLAEDEERQHEPGGELHPDAGRERHGRRAGPRGARLACALAVGRRRARRPGAQHQRKREGEQEQRVVVRAADGEDEQHRVQPEERDREGRRAPEPLGGASREPDRCEAAQHRGTFQRPEPAGEAQGRGGVAGEREQRPVGRVLEGPADEAEDMVPGCFGREVRVGVQAVQRAHASEGEVAEHVLGDQRRPEQEDHVGDHDRRRERGERQRPGRGEGDQVARADDQHERLEAALPERGAEPAERAREPARPAAGVGGHVPRRRRRRVDAEDRERSEERGQRDPAGRDQRRGRGRRGQRTPRPAVREPARPAGWRSGRGRRSARCLH